MACFLTWGWGDPVRILDELTQQKLEEWVCRIGTNFSCNKKAVLSQRWPRDERYKWIDPPTLKTLPHKKNQSAR